MLSQLHIHAIRSTPFLCMNDLVLCLMMILLYHRIRHEIIFPRDAHPLTSSPGVLKLGTKIATYLRVAA